MQKNEIVTVTIEDLSQNGEGIGKADGYTLFIKGAVIGDQVRARIIKAKKTYGYARIEELLEPSRHRVTPACSIAGPCGGCQLQNMSYEAQLAFKQKKVEDSFTRLGHFTEVPILPIRGMKDPFRYRNKAQIPVSRDKNGRLIAGFYAGRTHSVIPQEDCLLGVPENAAITRMVLAHMEQYHIPPYEEETGTGLLRHILIRKGFATGELMVCLIINGDRFPKMEELTRQLLTIPGMTDISLNLNKERNNVILGHTICQIYGQGYITDYIGNVAYHISPLSFYQVNPIQTEVLYSTALDYAGLTGQETVWDLYCGIGTISLFLAQKAKQVYGVEIVEAAIQDARDNAELNQLHNAEFFVGKAEEVLPRKYQEEHIQADVIVVDPPRKGCERAVLDTMIQMAPKRIVYVSCDPATLARDVRVLVDAGYQLEKVKPVDMFGGTYHVETVCLLSNRKCKPDSYVKWKLDMEDYYRIKDTEANKERSRLGV
ncbi:MAG: 23S rRNA (uracil(1939)-C(5))-methyltransferase RlmD [Lachnospiraceae bacterium]|nr:23S rRNA (uracil(1939)-C(5))-methyltransferase RlmD [Lachnospiraceae bacterium]